MTLPLDSANQLVPGTPCLKWRCERNNSPYEAVVPNVPDQQNSGSSASPKASILNMFQGKFPLILTNDH